MSLRSFAVFWSFLLGLSSTATAQADTSRSLPSIAVSASAEVQVKPNRATLSFAVETRAATAAAAAAENARRQRAVMDALRRLMSQGDELSTIGFSMHPDERYENNQRRPLGFVVRNTVLLQTQNLDRIGALIDAAVNAGANVVAGLRFWSTAADSARRVALGRAVDKARADAEVMAQAAGLSLGGIIQLSSGGVATPMLESFAARAMADTPITPGEETISAWVSVRWALSPRR